LRVFHETPLPRRRGVSRSRLDRGKAGKIRGIGAGEGSDRDPNPSKPRRQPAKDLDPRSGRVRRAMIAANSKATSAAFVCSFPAGHREAQNDADAGWRPSFPGVPASGATLAGICRAFASMQRCRLGSDHGRRRKPALCLNDLAHRKSLDETRSRRNRIASPGERRALMLAAAAPVLRLAPGQASAARRRWWGRESRATVVQDRCRYRAPEHAPSKAPRSLRR
jgi:hypothetical protein